MEGLTDADAGTLINDIYSDYITKATNTERATSSNKRVLFLNESYRKKQYEYNLLFFYVFIAIFIFCILVTLKRFVPFIPTTLINLLVIFVFFITFMYVVYKFYDIQRRYVLNFDEIDTNTDINYSDGSTEDKKDLLSDFDNYGYDLHGCKSDACCPADTIYDRTYRKCIPDLTDKYFGANTGVISASSPTSPVATLSSQIGNGDYMLKGSTTKYYYLPDISYYKGNVALTTTDYTNTFTVYSGTDYASTKTNPIIYITNGTGCTGNLVLCGKACVHKDKCPNR